MTPLKIHQVVGIIDSREQNPLDLSPMRTIPGTLDTGDYSLRGLTDALTIERKTLADFVLCCGSGRERFTRELHRLQSYQHKMVCCEFSWADIQHGGWRSRLTPATVAHSLLSWQSQFSVPFTLCGTRESAQAACIFFLFSTARRWWARSAQLQMEVED